MTPGVIEDGTHSQSGTYPCLDSSPRAMSYSFHSARVRFSCSDPLENLGPIFHQTNTVGMTQLASRMCVTKSAQLWETQAHTCRKQSLGLRFQTLAQRETAGRQREERCHGPYMMSPAAPWRWQPAKEESTVPTARVVPCPLERTSALGERMISSSTGKIQTL